jgi:hypothetical protein
MGVTVSEKIKSILASQRETETLGAERVRSLLEEVRRQIVAELVGMPSGNYSSYFLQSSLASIDHHLATWESAAQRELGNVLTEAWSAGLNLVPSAMKAAGTTFQLPWISSHTLDALKDFSFGKISGVKGDLYSKIKAELSLGVLGQKTPQEIAAKLAEGLADHTLPLGKGGFSIFKSVAERAEVITGLETGRAFSMATKLSIEAAQEILPEMEGMWVHAGHPRAPRQSHLLMHGQTRKKGAAFYTTAQGGKVFFPRDPQAPLSEVIRCGCDLIPWYPDFGSKADFAQDFDTQQLAAKKPKDAQKQ